MDLAAKIHHARQLRRRQVFEPSFVVIRLLVRPGEQVADLGSNYGLYATLLSELVGPSGLVYAVEPVPRTFRILTSIIKRLGLKNVRGFNMAISDREGSAVMEVPRIGRVENLYMSKIVSERSAKSRTIEVETTTLDSLVAGAALSFIKCDVEGHELQSVLGASDVIQRSHPAWLIEISGDPDDASSNARQLFAMLEAEGYTCCFFDGASLRRRKRNDHSVDYFFLRDEHFDRLRGRMALD